MPNTPTENIIQDLFREVYGEVIREMLANRLPGPSPGFLISKKEEKPKLTLRKKNLPEWW